MGYAAACIGTSERDRASALDKVMEAAGNLERSLEGVGARYMIVTTLGVQINLFSTHVNGDGQGLHSQYTVPWEDILRAHHNTVLDGVNEAHRRLLVALPAEEQS